MRGAPRALGVRQMGVKRVEEPPPPLLDRGARSARGIGEVAAPEAAGPKVYVAAEVHRALLRERAFSSKVEEGGFLFGRVYREAEGSERYVIEITRAIDAEHTEASEAHLTFTPESFASMRRRLEAAGGDAKLLGWYHTHVSGERGDDALSLDDLDLHFTTFRLPWQVAALVSLDPARDPEGRALRFFARRERAMARCADEVLA